MAGAGGATVQVAFLGRALLPVAPRRALDITTSGRQRHEKRIETLHRLSRAADHQAVAALEAPDAAAGTHVHVMDPLLRQLARPPQVVLEVRVAAVDDDVARLEPLGQRHHRLVGRIARRYHDPGGPRHAQFPGEIVK